jgi:BRCT domain type II-containing protein
MSEDDIDQHVDDDVMQSDELKNVAEIDTNKFDFDSVTGWFIDRAVDTETQQEGSR